MRAHRIPEGLVVRKAGLVHRFEVESHEALPLLVGDLQAAVNVNDVLKADVPGEAVGTGLRVAFDRRLKLEFHGATVTSDAATLSLVLGRLQPAPAPRITEA